MKATELQVVDTPEGTAIVLPDGRALRLAPMTFGKVRLTVSSSVDKKVYDDGW